jgi:hypothetical protein
MSLSSDTIIGLVALLIMCFPALLFLIRVIRYRYGGSSSPYVPAARLPIALAASDELSLMENGIIFAAVSTLEQCSHFELTQATSKESKGGRQ